MSGFYVGKGRYRGERVTRRSLAQTIFLTSARERYIAIEMEFILALLSFQLIARAVLYFLLGVWHAEEVLV